MEPQTQYYESVPPTTFDQPLQSEAKMDLASGQVQMFTVSEWSQTLDSDSAKRLNNTIPFTHKAKDAVKEAILSAGNASKAQAQDLMDRGQGSMTPAELLNGSLLDGEIIQMNGNALPFSSCEFFHFDLENPVIDPLVEVPKRTSILVRPAGQLVLTNKRLLLISSNKAEGASMQCTLTDVPTPEAVGCCTKISTKPRVYQAKTQTSAGMWFYPLSVDRVKHATFTVGTEAWVAHHAMASRESCGPFTYECCCRGCFGCFGCCCSKKWSVGEQQASLTLERFVQLSVELPPWGLKATIIATLLPSVSLAFLRDFLRELTRVQPQSML